MAEDGVDLLWDPLDLLGSNDPGSGLFPVPHDEVVVWWPRDGQKIRRLLERLGVLILQILLPEHEADVAGG